MTNLELGAPSYLVRRNGRSPRSRRCDRHRSRNRSQAPLIVARLADAMAMPLVMRKWLTMTLAAAQ
jgi:hypothetical protein